MEQLVQQVLQLHQEHAAVMQQLAATKAEHVSVVQQLAITQQQLAAMQQQQQHEQQQQAQNGVAPRAAGQGPRPKLPKPPVFTGRNREPTPQNWVHQMETYLKGNGVDLETTEAERYAAAYLADYALTWYRQHLSEVAAGNEVVYSNWGSFKEALVQQFTTITPERFARQKLLRLQQVKSVRTYAYEYQLCMLDLPNMHEKDRLNRFMEGLKPEIRIHVELKQPATLAEAVQLAIQVDSLMWQIKKGPALVGRGTYREVNARSAGPAPMEMGAVETRPRGYRPPVYRPAAPAAAAYNAQRRPAFSKSEQRCYYCKQLGHIKRRCPVRQEHMRANRQSN